MNRALLVGAALALDNEARTRVQRAQGEFGDDVASFSERLGRWGPTAPIVVGGSLLVGGLTEGNTGVRKGLAVISGMALGSLPTNAAKFLVGRKRPNSGAGTLELDPFSGHKSFPSGHATFIFSIAASIDEVTESPWLAGGAYGLATLTGFERIYDDKHWLSDVVAGAIMGTLSGRFAARRAARMLGIARRPEPGPGGDGAAGLPPGAESRGPRVSFLATAGFVGVHVTF
ncbi:MAG: phosphatase PAP2 family protein [Gemmatimonadota bacterium]